MSAPSQLQQLEAAVRAVRLHIPGLLSQTALFGVFTLLILQSTYILSHRDLHSRSNLAMLTVTIIMYAFSAAQWIIYMVSILAVLVQPSVYAIEDTHIVYGRGLASDLLLGINIYLSDVIVVWRACVMWEWHKHVVLVSGFLLLCNLGLYIAAFFMQLTRGPGPSERIIGNVANEVITRPELAAFGLSLAVNALATALIAYKAWLYRREIARYLREGNRKSAVEKVLILLVESGAMYCSVWIIYILCAATRGHRDGNSAVASFSWPNLVQRAFSQVTGIYPTAIIVIVLLQKSHSDHIRSPTQMLGPQLEALARGAATVELAAGSGSIWIIDRASNSAHIVGAVSSAISAEPLSADGGLKLENSGMEVFKI